MWVNPHEKVGISKLQDTSKKLLLSNHFKYASYVKSWVIVTKIFFHLSIWWVIGSIPQSQSFKKKMVTKSEKKTILGGRVAIARAKRNPKSTSKRRHEHPKSKIYTQCQKNKNCSVSLEATRGPFRSKNESVEGALFHLPHKPTSEDCKKGPTKPPRQHPLGWHLPCHKDIHRTPCPMIGLCHQP